MSNAKVAILVADSFGEPFETIKREMQPKIWNFSENFHVFYMIGIQPTKVQSFMNKFTDTVRYSKLWPIQRLFDQHQLSSVFNSLPHLIRQDNELKINIPEGLRYLGLKVIESIKFLYENNYDLIYKTTLSSLVNPQIFSETIKNIQLGTPFYGGTLIDNGNRPFVSGANLLINRETAEIILRSLDHWNHGFLDDVALGRLLEGVVAITPIRSMNFSSLEELDRCTNLELSEVMHFRCKSSSVLRNDVEIMSEVLKRIQHA
jgi:hypothetical protein